MADKATYSKSIVWKPDFEGVTAKQIATSGREVVNLKLVCGGASAHIDLYDSSAGTKDDLRWTMDVSQSGSDSDHFEYPLYFSKGIYAVMTTPAGTNAELGVGYIPDQV